MADSPTNRTVEILRQIRDQLIKTNDRVETLGTQVQTLGNQQAETNELIRVLVGSHSELNEKVEATNARLDSTNARLDRLTGEIVKSRTHDAARLLDLDERMARIEKHLCLERH